MTVLIRPSQRPDTFTLNPASPFAKGLVFAGLGMGRGSTTMRDSSVRRNNGTLTTMDPATDWVWSKELGRYYTDHDGINDYISIARPLTAVPITLACWALPANLTANHMLLGMFKTQSANTDAFYISATGGLAGDYVAAVSAQASTFRLAYSASAYSVTKWDHVCGVFATTTRRTAFLNGIAGTPNTDSSTPVSIDLCTIGKYYNGNNAGAVEYATAKIADALAWNRILTNSEISALADPANIDLRIGDVPLILNPPRVFFPSAGITRAYPSFGGRLTRRINSNGTFSRTYLGGRISVR